MKTARQSRHSFALFSLGVAALVMSIGLMVLMPKEPSNHYEALGVSSSATTQDIKKAYRAASLKLHPDRNPKATEWAKEQFIRLSEAHNILSDPHLRAEYDQQQRQFSMQQATFSSERRYTGSWWTIGAFWYMLSFRNFVLGMLILGSVTTLVDWLLPLSWHLLRSAISSAIPADEAALAKQREQRLRHLEMVRHRQQQRFTKKS